jgi:hypothetical protein
LEGTQRRGLQYGVLGKQAGALNFYAGACDGQFRGLMGGMTVSVNRAASLCAEEIGGTPMVGLKSRLGNRISSAVGLEKNGGLFYGLGYAVPLHTSAADGGQPDGDAHLLDSPSLQVASICHGRASWNERAPNLDVCYDDVEARDPIQTFGNVLRLSAKAAPATVNNVRIRISRFGITMIYFSAPLPAIRDYFAGRMTAEALLEKGELLDGVDAPEEDCEPSKSAGSSPSVLVTLRPQIGYRLGLKDHLPSKDWITADAIAPLPEHLFAVASQDFYLWNSLDSTPSVPQPGLGLYRVDTLGTGLMTEAGIDRESGSDWAAALRFAYKSPDAPVSLSGGARKSVESRTMKRLGFYGQASVEAYHGTLSVWARDERFLAGDTGESVGATRRFGQTFVTLSVLRTHYPGGFPYYGGPLEKVGIDVEFPLPRKAVSVGKVRIATSPTADFAYQPTLRTAPPDGLGDRDVPLLTPDTLQGRGQLTAQAFKLRFGEIARRP